MTRSHSRTTDDQGQRWDVRVPLAAWRPRWRRLDLDALWPTEWDGVGALALGAALLLLSLVAVIVVPALVFAMELTLLLVLLIPAVLVRLVGRRWAVRADQRTGDTRRHIIWRTTSWRRARRARGEIAAAIAGGRPEFVPAGCTREELPATMHSGDLPDLPVLGGGADAPVW